MKNNNDMKEKFRITSTFWICVSILVVGGLFCATYYYVHKDDGRYEYNGGGLIIDKKTGEAKKITFK